MTEIILDRRRLLQAIRELDGRKEQDMVLAVLTISTEVYTLEFEDSQALWNSRERLSKFIKEVRDDAR